MDTFIKLVMIQSGDLEFSVCRRNQSKDILLNAPGVTLGVVSQQVLDEVERRFMQSSIRAEEFLQAVYGRPLPSPGQSVTIKAMVRTEYLAPWVVHYLL